MHQLLSLPETIRLIKSNAALAIAGAPRALRALPPGRWIGGSTHYFVSSQGGLKSDDRLFVTELTGLGGVTFRCYGADEVEGITADTPETGFSLVIMPAASSSLQAFAQKGHQSAALFKTVVGWVAGTDLDGGATAPKAFVIDGRDGTTHEDAVIAAHVVLPPGRVAAIQILNPFESRGGPTLRFSELGFAATHCLVDGKPAALADFLREQGYDNGRLPLIGDFGGAAINVSIRAIDPRSGSVEFYAPVFPDIDYHLARPLNNYAQAFAEKTKELSGAPAAFGCNCILNYVFGELEGRPPIHPPGPITFGEVGYQLLNQTFVMLTIH
jgi:hypothetical protein